MDIRIFVTGGTFDKEYNELTGQLFFKDTHISEVLKRGRCNIDLSIRTLMMVDSKEMSEIDRKIILESCRRSKEERIVITHGTDTMVETASFLAEGGMPEGKTIILTGAMTPYKFGSSDGLFNLGSALAFAQTLPEGIYIAMNGRFFNYDNCVKNNRVGLFEKRTDF